MEVIQIGPWLGYDPRDDDWHCSYCNGGCSNGPRDCLDCHRPRLLTEEEKEHIRKSEQSGKMLCKKVMAGEFFKDNIDRVIECFRQWADGICQVVTIGEKRYVFVAIRLDKDEDTTKSFFEEDWREVKEYTFPEPKPLDEITNEICDIIRQNKQ